MGIRLETVENGRNTFLIEKWTKLIWDPSQTPDFKKFVRAPEWSDSTEINFGVQIHTYTIQENQVWDDSDFWSLQKNARKKNIRNFQILYRTTWSESVLVLQNAKQISHSKTNIV